MEDVTQKHTNIIFREFKEIFDKKEVHSYQSIIRYLTLSGFKFMECDSPLGYYIFTTTGMWELNKEDGLFQRVRETGEHGALLEENLTYYEGRKSHMSAEEVQRNRRNSKLKRAVDTEMMQDMRNDTELTYKELGIKYGVSATTCFNIVNRKGPWKNK